MKKSKYLKGLIILFSSSISFADDIYVEPSDRVLTLPKDVVDYFSNSLTYALPSFMVTLIIVIVLCIIKAVKSANLNESTPSEEEQLEQAEKIINTHSPIIPGLGNQNPIPRPTEEVEIDPKDMPWELTNEESEKDVDEE